MIPSPTPWRREILATLALGWPLVMANLAQIAITTTDVVMMGWLGPRELAAGSLGFNLFFAVFIAGLGLTMAAQPLLAQVLGRRRHAVREVRCIVRMGLWLSAALAIPLWMILDRTEAILLHLGQEPDLAAAAATYVRMLMPGLLPAFWFNVLRAFVSALERPQPALMVILAAAVFHAGSNWLLMFGHWGAPRLGLAGAGISSTLSQTVMAAALLAIILTDRRFRRFHLLGGWWQPHWASLRELLRVGVPMAVQFTFEVTAFNASALLMGLLGATAVAAHAVALQIASVTFMVPFGLGQAATVRVGLAAGAGDQAGVRRAGWAAFGLGIGFMTVMAAVLISAPRPLAGLFFDLANADTLPTLALAGQLLGVAGIFQIFDGCQAVGAGVLRGIKDTRVPMLFAGLGYWGIGLPLGAVLAFLAGLGPLGIWIGLAAGLALVAVLILTRWVRLTQP